MYFAYRKNKINYRKSEIEMIPNAIFYAPVTGPSDPYPIKKEGGLLLLNGRSCLGYPGEGVRMEREGLIPFPARIRPLGLGGPNNIDASARYERGGFVRSIYDSMRWAK